MSKLHQSSAKRQRLLYAHNVDESLVTFQPGPASEIMQPLSPPIKNLIWNDDPTACEGPARVAQDKCEEHEELFCFGLVSSH
jgi:hypothetical protein